MMRVSFTLAAINRVSGPVAAAIRSFEKLGAVSAAVSRMTGRNLAGLYDTTRDATYHFRKLAGDEGMARASRSAAYLRSQFTGLASAFSLVKYASVAAGIGIGEEFVRGVFKAGGEMQRMQATLTALNRNQGVANPAGAARASMAWMQNFGMGPGASMSFPDIMKAYQLSKESGINPEKNLTALADLAAARNVPLNRVIMAVNDAITGGTSRPLKMLGISMRRDKGKGGGATFDYSTISGKLVSERVAGDQQSVLAEIIKLSNLKYQGIALGMSKTLPGGIAQLQKLLYLFQARIAGSGVLDWAMGQINRFIAYINKASRDGSLNRWAKSISDFMVKTGNKLVAFVSATNWSAIGKDLALVGTSIAWVAKALALVSTIGGGGISGLVNLFVASKVFGFTRAILGLISPLAELALGAAGVSAAALPIEATIAAIALVAGGAFLFRRDWSGMPSWWTGLWAAIKGAVPPASDLVPKGSAATMGVVPKGFVRSPTGHLIETRLVTARNFAGGSGALVRFPIGPNGRLAPQAPALLRKPRPETWASPKFEGHMHVVLEGSGASQAQVRKLKSIGGTIDVRRGPIGAGS